MFDIPRQNACASYQDHRYSASTFVIAEPSEQNGRAADHRPDLSIRTTPGRIRQACPGANGERADPLLHLEGLLNGLQRRFVLGFYLQALTDSLELQEMNRS